LVKSKLISLLNSFSKDEFRSFGDFVNSPYFNREKVLMELYNILKKYHPGFTSVDFTKENVYSLLFKDKEYNDAVLRNTFSKLLKLAEKFLSAERFYGSGFQNKLFLLEELKSRKQEALFIKHKTAAELSLDTDLYRNEDYFSRKYLLEDLNKEFQKVTKNFMVFTDKEVADSYKFLINSILTNILKINASIINSNKNFFGENVNFILLEEAESYLSKNPELLTENIYMKYYYCIIKLFMTSEDKFFYELRDIIKNDLHLLSLPDRKNIFTTLTNYCYYRINNGEVKFAGEQFILYKLNIENGIYKGDRDFLSHILFMNVVTCGLDAGETEWTEDFIRGYYNALKPEHKVNMFNFSFALIHLRKKNYDTAMEFVSKVISDDLSYKHQLKSFYLKIYFELGEVQAFYSHIDSYRHFVKNDKLISPESRGYITNYITLSKKLFDMKNSPEKNKFEIQNMKKEITSHKSLINKLWLLKKVNEF